MRTRQAQRDLVPTDGTRQTHSPSKYLLHFQACSWPYQNLFIPYNSPVLQRHLTAGCAHPEGAPFTGLEAEAGQGEGPGVGGLSPGFQQPKPRKAEHLSCFHPCPVRTRAGELAGQLTAMATTGLGSPGSSLPQRCSWLRLWALLPTWGCAQKSPRSRCPWGRAGVAPRAAEPVGTPQPRLTPCAPAVPRAHPACPLSPQPVPEQSSSAGGAAAPHAQSFVQSHFQAQYR